jgi:hypothetical protein
MMFSGSIIWNTRVDDTSLLEPKKKAPSNRLVRSPKLVAEPTTLLMTSGIDFASLVEPTDDVDFVVADADPPADEPE